MHSLEPACTNWILIIFVIFKYVCLKDVFVKIHDFWLKQNKDKYKILKYRQQKAELKSKVKLKWK
jgi:hypothetical protein